MVHLNTVIAFAFLRLVVCEEAFRPTDSGVLSFGNFFPHKDHKLFAAKLKDERVKSSDECLVGCVKTHGCLSVNVNTTGDDQGLYVCELLASDKYENQSNFRPSKGIDHYSIATPCEKKPCKHQDKCVPFYTNNTYKCIPGCGQGWLQFDNNCYFFNHDSSKPAHWNDAANVCQLLGGHLVDIRNEYEWQFVKSNLKRAGDAYAQYIIGMTDAASEGHWKYTDGTAASFFKWNAGEPSGGTSENCASIFSDANIGSYNDGSCTYNYGRFICKKGAGQ